MSAIRQLKSRWSEAENDQLLATLRKGSILSPFGATPQEKLDLRGLVLRGILRNLKLADIDLSFTSTDRGGQFLACQLERCDFCGAALKTNLDGKFSDCSFSRGNLSTALFRGTFTRCSFQNSNFKKAKGEAVIFEECNFDGADFRGAHLMNSKFISCTWEGVRFGDGSLYRSQFVGVYPQALENTIIDGAEFV